MSEPMSDSQLQAIRKRVERATPGPWIGDYNGPKNQIIASGIVRSGPRKGMRVEFVLAITSGITLDGPVLSEQEDQANAVFIAASRQDVAALLAEVERLRALKETHP